MTILCPIAMFLISWQFAFVCFSGIILVGAFNLISHRILLKRFIRSHNYKEKLFENTINSFQTAVGVFNQNANEFDNLNDKLFMSDKIGAIRYGFSRFMHMGAMILYRVLIGVYGGHLFQNSIKVPPSLDSNFKNAAMTSWEITAFLLFMAELYVNST